MRLGSRIELSLKTAHKQPLLRFVAENTVFHGPVRHDGCVSVLSHVAGHAFPGRISGDMKVMPA